MGKSLTRVANAVRFSTEGIHPRERLSYWREIATRGYVEHDVRLDDEFSFNGTIEISTLPGLVMASYESDGARIRRPEKYSARADGDDLLLTLQFSGVVHVSQDGRENLISDRMLYLLDPLRPFDVTLKGHNRNLTVKVPRANLEARVGLTADMTAIPIAPQSAISTLAMGFMELLPQQAGALDTVAGLKVAEQSLDLVALAIAAHKGVEGAAISSPRAVARLRVKAIVERLLIEPGLKPERIATEAGISVRYANALLAEEGTSLERYLNERRLQRCRHGLEDPHQRHRSIGEIAYNWGFSDLAHFSRRFKARYGMTPTAFRREAERLRAREQIKLLASIE